MFTIVKDCLEKYKDNEIVHSKEVVSSSGRYSLLLTERKTSSSSWEVWFADVKNNVTNEIIGNIAMDYSHPFYQFIQKDGKEYLFFCPHYQHQAVVDLETHEVVHHAYDTFCWAKAYPSPSANILAVDGCYWAAGYDLRFYDISDPMAEKFPILKTVDSPHDSEKHSWTDENTFTCLYHVYKGKDGKDDDEPPWKAHECYWAIVDGERRLMCEDIIGNKSFAEDGEYTQEYIDNFFDWITIKVKEDV